MVSPIQWMTSVAKPGTRPPRRRAIMTGISVKSNFKYGRSGYGISAL